PITPSLPRGAGREPVAGVGRPRVSPVARRRAAELGLDVGLLTGSGSGGAVILADVEAAASTRAPAPAPQPVPAAPAPAPDDAAARAAAMRAAIGQLMSRSKREIPHYYLAHTVELSAVMRWLKEHNAGRSVAQRVLPAAVLLRATAVAATRVPEVNGHFVDGIFQPSAAVHLGVAVNLRGGGLVTPALHAAERLDVDALMAALQDLVMRARAGHLKRTELSEGTITVTSLGERGVELVHGVIVPPQVALVGIGTVVDRPWAVGDAVAVRPVVTVTFSGDHRAGDGHLGARFLVTLDELLQRPEDL
ncbi:MAG: 2-oxo acid dehydrogenase subunit E2, partial [Angustibacter sp.]